MKKEYKSKLSSALSKVSLFLSVVFVSLASTGVASAQCFTHPPSGDLRVTSVFGQRLHPISKIWKPHNGIDLAGPTGVPLYAVENGMIVNAEFMGAAGLTVEILINNGTKVRYLHLNRKHVKKGESVKAGQRIGDVGTTGGSTGPHLHFEVRLNSTNPVNPRPYICGLSGKSDGSGSAPPVNGPIATNGIPNNDYPPMGSSTTTITAPAPQASAMTDYTGMSTQQFLAAEAEKRFGNPQWYRDLSNPLDELMNHPDPQVRAKASELPVGDRKTMLLKEILFMMNVKDFFALEEADRKDRIQQMLATELADATKEYSDRVLQQLRSQANSLQK